MSKSQTIHAALYGTEPQSKRQIRAARTRAQALSPVRIILRLVTLPFLALSVAISIYIRTSDYDPPDAMAHLIARASCDMARSIGLAPSYRGGLGYHARNDTDGDGVACNEVPAGLTGVIQNAGVGEPMAVQGTPSRMAGGAKFVKP